MARIRAVRELGRRAHPRGGRAARAGRLRDRRAVHARSQPRPRDLLDPGRAGDLLRRRAVPGLGRPHRPARGRRADAARVDPHAASTRCRTRRRSTRVTWASPRSAPSGPPTRSWPSWRGTAEVAGEAPGPAGHVRRAARGRPPPAAALRAAPAELLEARGLRADRDAHLRGHRAVRARGGRVHRHRPEGDVHLRGPGRALADAAARGHRRRLPRLRRARHAQAAAAGEALVLAARSSATRRRRRAATASSPRSAPRRIGSDDPTLDAEADPAAGRAPRAARARGRRGCGCRASARPRRARAYLDELRAYLRAHEGELSEEVRAAHRRTTRCARSTPTTRAPRR